MKFVKYVQIMQWDEEEIVSGFTSYEDLYALNIYISPSQEKNEMFHPSLGYVLYGVVENGIMYSICSNYDSSDYQ